MADREGSPASTLTARAISVARGGRHVIADVTLSIGLGEVYVLRGPNGSGKTTLLRTLGGFIKPACGAIDRAGVTSVFLGHADGVKGALTVRENIDFWRRLYVVTEVAAERAQSQLRVARFAGQVAATLSAGQRRRLALCRVAMSGRALWLLDEPTAGMDAAGVIAVVDLIGEHVAQGGGAVVATHEPLAIGGARTITLSETA
jgi:heme exporter protein A